jgi:hypothetical protein
MSREGDSKGPRRLGAVILIVGAVGGIYLTARSVQDTRIEVLIRSYGDLEGPEKGRQARALLSDGPHAGRLIRWGIGREGHRATVVAMVREVPAGDLPAEVGDAALEALTSGDQATSEAAAQILAHLGDRMVDPLRELLEGGPDVELATRVITVLIGSGERGERAVAQFYLGIFGLPDRDLRKDAVEEIMKMGPAATPVLVEALDHPEVLVRLHSALALLHISDPRSVQALIRRLPGEEDLGVKVQIGATLHGLTGRADLGHDAEGWDAYWRREGASFPPQVLPSRE